MSCSPLRVAIIGRSNVGRANNISARLTGVSTDATPARLMEKPTWLLSETSRHAHRLLTEKLAGAGSRGYDYRLLAALQEFGAASQAQLGRHAGMDRSDVVATVNDLADRGLAERAPDPADARRNVITLTPAGAAHLRRLDRLLGEAQDELLAPLSPSEREQLVRLLTQVLEHHTS
jgi:DNA-binding MarR family transcriptional regulator